MQVGNDRPPPQRVSGEQDHAGARVQDPEHQGNLGPHRGGNHGGEEGRGRPNPEREDWNDAGPEDPGSVRGDRPHARDGAVQGPARHRPAWVRRTAVNGGTPDGHEHRGSVRRRGRPRPPLPPGRHRGGLRLHGRARRGAVAPEAGGLNDGPDLPWRGPRRAVRGRRRRDRTAAHADDRTRPRGPLRPGRERVRGHGHGHRELPRGADREGRPQRPREQGCEGGGRRPRGLRDGRRQRRERGRTRVRRQELPREGEGDRGGECRAAPDARARRETRDACPSHASGGAPRLNQSTRSTTFPNCSPRSRYSWALRASCSGNTLSTTGFKRPMNTSFITSSNSFCVDIVEPITVSCRQYRYRMSSSAIGPLVAPGITSLPPFRRDRRLSLNVAAPTWSRTTSTPRFPVSSHTAFDHGTAL